MERTTAVLLRVVSAMPSRGERGAAATEYALILAGIAVLIIGGIFLFGEWGKNAWESLTAELQSHT